MRRALVLTDETARHPFRASLPPHVRDPDAAPVPARGGWRFRLDDLRDFFLAYTACFVAVTSFIG